MTKPFGCRIGLHTKGNWVFDDDECRFYFICIGCGTLIGKVGHDDEATGDTPPAARPEIDS